MSVEIIGPFKTHFVVVHGYEVPLLEATPFSGGRVLLTMDGRFSVEVPVADLQRYGDFIAQCIAVARGFTCHPGTDGTGEPHPHTGYHRRMEATGLDTRP
ncbi:MAG: hypothetical protein ABI047_01075 [Jatrophihabitantaceae bacterium]